MGGEKYQGLERGRGKLLKFWVGWVGYGKRKIKMKEIVMIGSIVDGFRPLLPVLVWVGVLGILVVIVSAFFTKTQKSPEQDFSSYTLNPFVLSKAGDYRVDLFFLFAIAIHIC